MIGTEMTQLSRSKTAQAVYRHVLAALSDDTDCNVSKPFVKKFGRKPYSASECRWAAKSPIDVVEELHSEGTQGGQFQLLAFAKLRVINTRTLSHKLRAARRQRRFAANLKAL